MENPEQEIEVQIVNFYPKLPMKRPDKFSGTMHVHLPQIGIDIRGVHVKREKNFWYFRVPFRSEFDEITKKWVNFPVVVFNERRKDDELRLKIKEKGIQFIEKFLNPG